MNARSSVFNALPNIFWTTIFLGPVYFYCVHHLDLRHLVAFAVTGTIPFALPRSLLERLQLSPNVEVYRLLHVPLLVRLTQDAPWTRRAAGEVGRRVVRDRQVITHVIRDTWMRERFHLGLLLFCALCAFAALRKLQLAWFISLILTNTLYNLYPIWLQQYLRLRLIRLHRRLPAS